MLNRMKQIALSCAILAVIGIAIAACGDASDDASVASPPTAQPVAMATRAPQPTAVPEPSPTVAPTAIAVVETPTPFPPNPEVERFAERGMELLTRFTEEYSPRQSGTDGERAAAEFIGGYLEDLGYRVEYQPVEVEHIPWGDEFVSLAGDDRLELRAIPLSMTGMGDVTGPLVWVGKAFNDEFPEEGLDGAIALIERGEITFEVKVNRAARGRRSGGDYLQQRAGELPRRAAIGRPHTGGITFA